MQSVDRIAMRVSEVRYLAAAIDDEISIINGGNRDLAWSEDRRRELSALRDRVTSRAAPPGSGAWLPDNDVVQLEQSRSDWLSLYTVLCGAKLIAEEIEEPDRIADALLGNFERALDIQPAEKAEAERAAVFLHRPLPGTRTIVFQPRTT